jgi:hypothetical protein
VAEPQSEKNDENDGGDGTRGEKMGNIAEQKPENLPNIAPPQTETVSRDTLSAVKSAGENGMKLANEKKARKSRWSSTPVDGSDQMKTETSTDSVAAEKPAAACETTTSSAAEHPVAPSAAELSSDSKTV